MLKPMTLTLLLAATPALADYPYLDDRSTPEAVVQSLYNAINRHELVRAWSYWQGGSEEPVYRSFASGYAKTDHVDLVLGKATSEGAAGSTYYSLPVAIRAVDTAGNSHDFAGCYVLRQVNPALFDVPPFHPIHLESGDLQASKGGLQKALPKSCN